MNIIIKNGRVIDPASSLDEVCDIYIKDGIILSIGAHKGDFKADQVIDAKGLVVAPGLVDLMARLKEPGYEHEGMLESELKACVSAGVTTLVCPPDTDPVLDEPGLVDMLQFKAQKMNLARVHPLGALTKGLHGEALTEMFELTQAGCIGFAQAEVAISKTHILQRAMQYAATYGYCVWLRPQDYYLGQGVAASGALATRLGLSGVPVAAETIALNTIFALMKSTGAQVHLCRISSAAGVSLVAAAKAEGLPLTCDVSINSLHLIDQDIGYFDSRARLTPVLRQQADRAALREGLASGVIDALVSDHNPVEGDLKALPFAQAEPGATGVELLLSLALKWGQEHKLSLVDTLRVVTSGPAKLLRNKATKNSIVINTSLSATGSGGVGELKVGGVADICIFDPESNWMVHPSELRSQGKFTPFDFELSGAAMVGTVKMTMVGGHWVYTDDAH